MKKKIIFVLICSVFVFGLLFIGINSTSVWADEVTDEPVTDEPVTDEPVTDEPVVDELVVDEPVVDEPVTDEKFECVVKTNISDGGGILIDKEEGHVGDIVTAYIKPDFLFSITSIKINGIVTPVSKDNNYKFALVQGENTIDVEFAINNEKLKEIANIINNVKDNGWSSLFTMANLLNLISWIISILLSSGFFLTLIKNKKLKARTTDQIVDLVEGTLKSEIGKAQLEFLENVIKETMSKITIKMDNVDSCVKVLCRCFILAQEDTPESRLAIIEELTKLNTDEEALTEQIRQVIKQEQEKQQKAILDRDEAIKKLKEINESIIDDNSGDNYGQI